MRRSEGHYLLVCATNYAETKRFIDVGDYGSVVSVRRVTAFGVDGDETWSGDGDMVFWMTVSRSMNFVRVGRTEGVVNYISA